ncbi:hypothetical protein RMCBS344292_05140 [Rhizopus microsporus]|nr:hypothetical protein RMCBS344292_05140 [Rhizopus microsporus]
MPQSSKEKKPTELNPRTTSYEFLGPIGALAMVTVLPLLVLFLATCCDATGYPSRDLFVDWKGYLQYKFSVEQLVSLFDKQVFMIYCGYVAALALFYIILPGDNVPGTVLRDGTRLKYKLNGSFGSNKLLALGGNTGNPIYDFMIGRELNPRIGSFDIKFFTELRPGLIGWLVINYCLAAKQYLDLGYITNTMILVQFFQTWYVIDSLWNEEAVLTTMDITTDGFGFMLAFGLYTWVPFTYTLQARYLVDFPRTVSWFEFGAILTLNFLGYYIFRGANSQKNEFRAYPNSPSSKKLKYIETKTGSRLIISGWWGMSRHINYLGDWLMALSWSLPCGFGSVIPYFYPIYFAILLLHRERRDDHKCRTKYGADWEKYCKINHSR